MTEKDIWHQLKKHWQTKAHCVRIENSTSFGDPDVNVCCKGKEFWIENKIDKGGYIIIRPAQLAWLSLRHRAWGTIYFIVGNKYGTVALYNTKDLFTNHGLQEISGQIKLCLDSITMLASGTISLETTWDLFLDVIIKGE